MLGSDVTSSGDESTPAVCPLDLPRHLLASVEAFGKLRHDHVGPGFRQPKRHLPAQARPRPRDERDLAVETQTGQRHACYLRRNSVIALTTGSGLARRIVKWFVPATVTSSALGMARRIASASSGEST